MLETELKKLNVNIEKQQEIISAIDVEIRDIKISIPNAKWGAS